MEQLLSRTYSIQIDLHSNLIKGRLSVGTSDCDMLQSEINLNCAQISMTFYF